MELHGTEEAPEIPKRPFIGTGLLPRETYRMTDRRVGNLTTAYWWGLAHSWVSNFGIYGHPETEETKIRMLLSKTTPPVLLLELNSKGTFNMLDPVLCTDFNAVMDAYQMLLTQKQQRLALPLAAVLQGAGPHFCPGGNHHPVSPHGATPWSMSTRAASSVFIVRMKEMCIPSVAAVTGSAIGGGVAISLNCTERVITQNGSAAFGNISRGACPIMWLSKHLPQHVGLAAAMNIYLTDSTFSASALQKAGLVTRVAIDNKATKATAFQFARRIAASPLARFACAVQPVLDILRFDQECRGLQLSSITGEQNFPGVKKTSDEVQAAIRKPRAKVTEDEKGASEFADNSASDADVEESSCPASAPQPFPSATGNLRPVQVTEVAARMGLSQCVTCGAKDRSGTVYGHQLYCHRCWEERSRAAQPETMVPQGLHCARCGDGRDLVPLGDSYECKMCGPGAGLLSTACASPAGPFCATCSKAASGRYGAGAYSKDFYCDSCWRKWEAWPAVPEELPTDVGTDQSNDSGTEATVIDSERARFTSGSDMEL
eukprot:TRINITY_DN92595_c0_g1_i1.p1 TRINITY_DN92595_c0_g1~~TRINITY_DN92595_c0_g1_i1.p1  ORF type:complete len:545 (-),score=94.65 TRINITY_DN92595_c0_g1_i1:179-1813(-)